MGRAGRKASLFEAMTKTPQVENPTRRSALAWWRRRGGSGPSPLIVAEPLTEEEAVAELASQRDQPDKTARDKRARRPAATGEDDAKRRRLNRVEGNVDAADETAAPFARITHGRLVLTLNTTSSLVTAGAICILVLGSYSIGRRSMGVSDTVSPAAAIKKPGARSGTPLLPNPASDASRPQARPAINPDLSHLLSKPPARLESEVAANQPARVEAGAEGATWPAEKLNYLQIESFPFSSTGGSERVRKELDDVRRFLAERGIATFARRLSNGYVLFSERGFPPSKEYAQAREAYRQEIEALGKEYRRAGGRYEFKGCLFVSHSRTRLGRPA